MKTTLLLPMAALLLAATLSESVAAPGITAKTALDRISAKYGPGMVGKIVEMKGARGQSQPMEWWIVVNDERSRYRLRTLWVGDVRATDEGENDDFYPARLPVGYASVAKLKIDSTAAFEVMVREAQAAKVGFDSVDYKLRSAEFGDEPIWSLTAKDGRGRVVGRVVLSGFDAAVFRTVWFYKSNTGYPRIVDSALDGLKTTAAPLQPTTPVPLTPLERPAPDPVVPGPLIDPGDPGTERAVVEPVAPKVPAVPE